MNVMKPTDDSVHIDDNDSRETHINKLLQAINDIDPNKLGHTSYDKFIKHLFNISEAAIRRDSTCLILIVEAIKGCTKPCYKRDVLLEVLDQIVFSPASIITHVLCDTFNSESRNVSWKVIANSIATLPDLVANKGALEKFINFQPEEFFTLILKKLYDAIGELHKRKTSINEAQTCLYIQLIGRISFSGFGRLVWEKFFCILIGEKQVELKTIISDILTFPLRSDHQSASQFELFIEPLYMPIFLNFNPSKNSGKLIKSILGNHILNHESFEYLICNKSIFQANYKLDRHRQSMLLFNIFAYLSCLTTDEHNLESGKHLSGSPSNKDNNSNLLIKTLLEIARSWSNSTKILCRNYEQNRYISQAFIIAFRYASESDKLSLLEVAEDIRAEIMRGFEIYLNRAASEFRQLALCVGETVLRSLHELVDQNLPKDQHETKEPLNFDFAIELDDTSLEMKRLFRAELGELFVGIIKEDGHDDARLDCIASKESIVLGKTPFIYPAEKSEEESTRKSRDDSAHQQKRVLIESGSDDDLLPHELDDDDDDDCDVDNGADSMNLPIYLQDCIDGLAENNNPRYFRLCLIKVVELIRQLSDQEAIESKSIKSIKQQHPHRLQQYNGENDSALGSNDAIRDTAKELARLLLFLDNQYGIEDFDTLRINALISLCVAVPGLVVKYLLDEFNGSNKSTRHQLDILQTLTASARQLSGCSDIHYDKRQRGVQVQVGKSQSNKFVKYVSLYFYGIVHPLKADLSHSISPATIVTATKSQGYSDVSSGRGETLIKRVIIGLANSKNQVSILHGKNFLPPLARTPATETLGQGEGVLVKEISSQTSSEGSSITSTSTTTSSTTTTKSSQSRSENDGSIERRYFMDDGQRLGQNCDRSDDSYLLSRIFFSIAVIIECVKQQPITCKLSNDLLDILATYRYHPDSGVRKAIAGCLTAIRDSTPSVYFKEYLYDKVASLFGDWITNELEILELTSA